jgi:UPF0716 family protein affecting phage T7 exclusion
VIERTKENWRELKASGPGQRFQDRYTRRQEASHGRWDKRSVLNIGLGIAITLAGLLLIPAPGPGFIIAFLGLGLLGSEFAPIARALDRAEVKARAVADRAEAVWERAPLIVKALLVLAAAACAAALAYGAYRLFVGG